MESKTNSPHPIRFVTAMVFVIGCMLAIGTTASAAVFNLANDWIANANPNGAWKYESVNPGVYPVVNVPAFMATKALFTSYNAGIEAWYWGGRTVLDRTYVHADDIVGASLTWVASGAASCAITGSIVTNSSQTTGIDLGVLFYDVSAGTISSLWSGTTTVGGPMQTWNLAQAVDTNDQILFYVPENAAYGTGNESVTEWTANIVTTVPEPASLILVGLGGLALLRRKK